MNYTIIKNLKQYYEYCDKLYQLDCQKSTKKIEDEKELLDLLIEKWDDDHNTFEELDPIQLLKGIMENKKMKAVDLADLLNITKGAVSQILNYKKGLSKEVIRKLCDHFKMRHEAFNRPYKMKLAKKPKKKIQMA